MIQIIPLLLGLIFSSNACDIYQPDQFNFSTSANDRSFFAYKNNGDKSFAPFFRLSGCDNLSKNKKYLMISFGPQNQELSDRIKAYDIANQVRDSGCKIINNPFHDPVDFPRRKLYLEEKWKAIKSCYRVIVKDEGIAQIRLPDKQPGCDHVVTKDNELEFKGGFCFLTPEETSSYRVGFKLKDECLDYEGLKKLDVKVTDFQAVLNFYSAGDPTGSSLDLTSLKSFPLRFNVSPNASIIPNSDVFGETTPQFPSRYFLPDTHLGTPEAVGTRPGKVRLRIPLWADNTCQSTCTDGYCQGACDYSQPLVGEVEYYELTDKGKVLDLGVSWFQGGIILPRYQGEIAGTTQELDEENFSIGKTYRVVMRFNDPKFDFQSFKQEFRTKIQRTTQGLPSIGSSSIPLIPQLGNMTQQPLIPEMIQIGNINFSSRLSSSFEGLLDSFTDFLNFKYWPPYYQEICHDNCRAIKDDYLVLTMDFKVVASDSETKKFEVEVLRTARSSTLLETYERTNPQMPKITCTRPRGALQGR